MECPESRLVEVYRAKNLPEAHAIRMTLEESGIPVQIDGELLQGVAGEVPLGWATAPRILVAESQASEARELILQEHDSGNAASEEDGEDEKTEPTTCLACGQMMNVGVSKCAACGWSYQSSEDAMQAVSPGISPAAPVSERTNRPITRRPLVLLVVIVGVITGAILIRWMTSADLQFQRGLDAIEKENYDLAITCFDAVIGLEPKNSAAYYNRGLAYSHKGSHEQAIKDFTIAIQHDPSGADAFSFRGFEYDLVGKYDLAIADFNRAIRLDPRSTEAYGGRGYAYEAIGEYEKAQADYRKMIEIEPKDAYGHSYLAWLWATCPQDDMRNGSRAVEYARKACEFTNWKVEDFWDTLAAAYAEAGEFDKAVKWQKKVLDSPGFAKASPEREKERNKARLRLTLYEEGKPYRDFRDR